MTTPPTTTLGAFEIAAQFLPTESAFLGTIDSLPPDELVPALRRELAAARPRRYYEGKASLAVLTMEVGAVLYDKGRPRDAAPLLQEALQELDATLGSEHRKTLWAKLILGRCLHDLEKDQEAEPLLVAALAGFTRLCGEDHNDTLKAMTVLASLRNNTGAYAAAEALYVKALTLMGRQAAAAGRPPGAAPPGTAPVFFFSKQSLCDLYRKTLSGAGDNGA